ncbi:MAG: sigma 54-interacting transcriptional regulator, partial [Myxococcota bacterium]
MDIFRNVWPRMPAMLHVTGPGGLLAAVSDHWLERLGYARDEVIGQRVTGFMAEPWRSEGAAIVSRVFRTGELRKEDRTFLTKTGERVDVVASADVVRGPRGEVQYLLVALHEVTEQRRAEREREEALREVLHLKDRLEAERDYLREEVLATGAFGDIVGVSEARGALLRRIGAVAATGANVLVVGESGTGKELVARAIHRSSERRTRSLVKVNCASIPRDLFESEFFGHVRGAFTGAHRDRPGTVCSEGALSLKTPSISLCISG